MIPFVQDDGGRAAAGYTGTAGDCGARALAIAAQLPYQEAYDLINTYAARERPGAKRRKGRRSSARSGVFRPTMHKLLADLGFAWVPCMTVGSGCKVHLVADELPAKGRLILSLSKHYAAFIDGVLHDTYCDDRAGTRCVYGYWIKDGEGKAPEPPAEPAKSAREPFEPGRFALFVEIPGAGDGGRTYRNRIGNYRTREAAEAVIKSERQAVPLYYLTGHHAPKQWRLFEATGYTELELTA